jgi:hypothetical protein
MNESDVSEHQIELCVKFVKTEKHVGEQTL